MNVPTAQASAPSFLLREATAATHHSVEQLADWDMIFGSLDGYARFLARLHGVLAAAEAATDELLDEAGVWAKGRRRASWVADDLLALGRKPEVPAGPGGDFAWATTVGQAAGVTYVLEGSALGGVHLAARARRALGLGAEQTRYLAGHGSGTLSHWQQVKCWLDHVLTAPPAQQQAIEAANRTFEIYSRAVEARH